MTKTLTVAAAGLAAAFAFSAAASAAEITVVSSNAIKTVLEELGPQFEKASEHKLNFKWGAAAPLKVEIEKGLAFDVALLTTGLVDDLVKQGKLVAATRADVARSNTGVAVRKGAPKPDISTVEAFKRALLEAKSIAYVEQGQSGLYLKGLFERLGIAEQIRSKIKFAPTAAAEAIANGFAEIGITQVSEILPYPGAELVGPLPKEIQNQISFATAAGSAAKQPAAASALIKFITAPSTAAVYKAKGLEPPT